MSFLKVFFVTLVSVSLIDFIWLGIIASQWYKKMLGDFARPLGEYRLSHWASGVLVYVLLVLGVMVFVLPRLAGSSSFLMVAGYGALFGLIVYGIYEFTNYTILKGWPGAFIALDVVWGAVIGVIAVLLARWYSSIFS